MGNIHCGPERIIARVECAAVLVKLVREDKLVGLAVVTHAAVNLQRGIRVDEAREPGDQRDLASGIRAAEIEGAIVGLVALGVECDNGVSSEQGDETEEKKNKTSDVRNPTQSED